MNTDLYLVCAHINRFTNGESIDISKLPLCAYSPVDDCWYGKFDCNDIIYCSKFALVSDGKHCVTIVPGHPDTVNKFREYATIVANTDAYFDYNIPIEADDEVAQVLLKSPLFVDMRRWPKVAKRAANQLDLDSTIFRGSKKLMLIDEQFTIICVKDRVIVFGDDMIVADIYSGRAWIRVEAGKLYRKGVYCSRCPKHFNINDHNYKSLCDWIDM